MAVNDETMIVKKKDDEQNVASMILEDVYNALKEKGYNPISQMAGYLFRATRHILRAIIMLAAIFAVLSGMNWWKNCSVPT